MLADLTPRELEILSFLEAGRSNRDIANQLVISDKTVSVHVSNILRKTGTKNRLEAAALAQRLAAHRNQ
jgi:DNA-binding NarL/FixJ family response regulator